MAVTSAKMDAVVSNLPGMFFSVNPKKIQINRSTIGKCNTKGCQRPTQPTNLGSSTTGLNLYANMMPDLVTYMLRYLAEANAHDQPWCVAPPWFMQLIGYGMITYGTKQFDAPGSVNAPRPVEAFPFMGINFYQSNNVSNDGTDYRIMFGTSDAIGFAMQLEEIEAVRLENYFSDGIKGLNVYGSKVIRPDHLGVIYAQFSGLTT